MVKRDNRGCCKINCKRKSMTLLAMSRTNVTRPHLESIVKYGDGRHFQPVLFSAVPCNLSKRPRPADVKCLFSLAHYCCINANCSNAKANVHFHFCPPGNGRQGNKTFFTWCVLRPCDIVTYFTSSASHWSLREGTTFIFFFFPIKILQRKVGGFANWDPPSLQSRCSCSGRCWELSEMK